MIVDKVFLLFCKYIMIIRKITKLRYEEIREKNMFERVDKLKLNLNNYRPLTKDDLRRLRDEFLIEFTYNSNAIEGNALTLQETALVLNEGITRHIRMIRRDFYGKIFSMVNHHNDYKFIIDNYILSKL